MLFSATEEMSRSSIRFHEKSETFSVCPACTKISSGGPSASSSGVYSSPILPKSQIQTLLSPLEVAK